MSKVNQIIRIFFRHEFSKGIQKEVQTWLLSSHSEGEKDSVLRSIWDEIQVDPDDSTEQSLYEVCQRADIRKRNNIHSLTMKLSKIAKIAAVFFIPLLSVIGSYVYVQKNNYPGYAEVRINECFVPNGEIREIILPDRSVVTVNSGSVIIFPEQFDEKTRIVYLNGEAYFSVIKDEKRPFIVKTESMDVEVLGTVFNISSYSDDSNVTTTLEEGQVKLSFKDKDIQEIILDPCDQIILDRKHGTITRKIIDSRYISAWKQGYLIFQRASIYEIIHSFEKKYNVTIYLNSDNYQNEILSVKFSHGETLEESLQILQQIIPGFNYKQEGKKVYIY